MSHGHGHPLSASELPPEDTEHKKLQDSPRLARYIPADLAQKFIPIWKSAIFRLSTHPVERSGGNNRHGKCVYPQGVFVNMQKDVVVEGEVLQIKVRSQQQSQRRL